MTNIKVVILVGGLDFGRCPIASRLNRALWPVFGKPALQRTIDLLACQGLRDFVVCCRGDEIDPLQQAIHAAEGATLAFSKDVLPRGPAGCIRDAVDFVRDDLLLVLSASMVSPPDIQMLCAMHAQSGAPLTVFLNPPDHAAQYPLESGIYLCAPEAVKMIPERGYMDLKEGLILELVRAGKTAQSRYLPVDSGNFRTWEEYVTAVQKHLLRHAANGIGIDGFSFTSGSRAWVGADASISAKAQLCGPVVIGRGAVIEDGAVLVGPSVIGENVRIGQAGVIEESIVWNDAVIMSESYVRGGLVGCGVTLRPGRILDSVALTALPTGLSNRMNRRAARKLRRTQTQPVKPKESATLSGVVSEHLPRIAFLCFALLLVLLLFTYRATLRDLWSVWLRSDEYSSGLLVPLLAGYLFWIRRQQVLDVKISGPSFWGILGLAAAQGVRYFGLCYSYDCIERLSLVLSIGSLVLLAGGKNVFRKCVPIFLFLFLMLPLPRQVEMQIAIPLQKWATTSAVFCLEMLGFSVRHEGNIIHIGSTMVAVAEACNGLRMLTAFLVVSGMVVLLIHRTRLQKALILLSSIPVALICNTVRLTVTAIFFTFLDTARWERFFHDFGGFAMMPVALAIIALELWILGLVLVDAEGAT